MRATACPHEVGTGVAGRLLLRLDRAQPVETGFDCDPFGHRVVDVVVDLDAVDPGPGEACLGEANVATVA